MIRIALFVTFGIAVGAGYGSLIWIAALNERGAATVWFVVCLLFFGLLGLIAAVRKGNYATWRRLAVVVGFPLLAFVLIGSVTAMIGVAIVVVPAMVLLGTRDYYLARQRLTRAGRFLTMEQLRPSLTAGHGTVITDWSARAPAGLWWTEDDLLALGEFESSNEELHRLRSGESTHALNDRCWREYLDRDTGKAKFTPIPWNRVATSEFRQQFPLVRIVDLVEPWNPLDDR